MHDADTVEDGPEIVHDDTLSRIVYEAIAATRAPTAHVGWDDLSDNEQAFYREAAGRMSAAGALNLLAMPDDALEAEAPVTAGTNVINIRHALSVNAISVAMWQYQDGEAALIGHFGGNPRNDPERTAGVAWITTASGTAGLLRQIIEAWAAVDLETAGDLVKAAVKAMERAIESRGLTIPAIRTAHPGRN